MNKLAVILLSIFVSYSCSVFGKTISATVSKVNKEKRQIIVQSENLEGISKGDTLKLNENCSFDVTKMAKGKALLTVRSCKGPTGIATGKSIQLETAEVTSDFSDEAEIESRPQQARVAESHEVIAQGIRISLHKAFMEGEAEASFAGYSYGVRGDVDYAFGIGGGYGIIKVKAIGFIGDLIYSVFNNDVSSIRVDGNITYGLENGFYFSGGLNVHRFFDELGDLGVGLGLQAGGGYQFHPNFGASLQYLVITHSGDINGVELEMDMSGPALIFYANF